MNIPDFNFDRWRAERQAKYDAIEKRIREQLEIGGTVLEVFGRVWTAWQTERARRILPEPAGKWHPPFVERCLTPEYIAEHLRSRHEGFGTELTFDGLCNECGLPRDEFGRCRDLNAHNVLITTKGG